jgi:hypothetical protein
MERAVSVIVQKSYAESVVKIGDRITGTDVTMGGSPKEGVVTDVIGPIRVPDCGGYRYKISTDETYSTGGPVTRIVYAERLVDER